MVVLAGATALMGGSPAANAAYYHWFDISGQVPGYAGSGRTYGSIEFFPNPRTQMRVAPVIGDICPADGKGMELRIRVKQTNGVIWMKNNVIQDLNDCGNGWESLPAPVDYFAPNPIDQARAELWATEGGTPFVTVAVSGWKVHP